MRPRVTTNKHIVQVPINSVMAGTILSTTILRSVNVVSGSSTEVVQGATVSAIYIEMWLLAGAQQPGSITVTLEKRIGSMGAMSFAMLEHVYRTMM